jgi:hypothetical protein
MWHEESYNTFPTPFRILVNINTRNVMDKILIFRIFTLYINIYKETQLVITHCHPYSRKTLIKLKL